MTIGTNLPVLICAYSRVDEFCSVLSSSISAGSRRIYVNLDGANNSETLESQLLMINFAQRCRNEFPDLQISLRRSKTNLGAAASVISSIDWFFSFEDFGIVLEDDLQFDNQFFAFASWAEKRFRSNQDVWILSGTNFLSVSHGLAGHFQFPTYPVTWGWATWSSKWASMRNEILRNVESRNFLQSNPVSNFWKIGARRAKLGFIDAWDIPLAEAMHRLKKLSVVSPINLVRNIGYSKLASNTHRKLYPLDLDIQKVNSTQDFELFFAQIPISAKELNPIYERLIYGISCRNHFTSLLSIFDAIRYRKNSRGLLRQRLNSISENTYEFF